MSPKVHSSNMKKIGIKNGCSPNAFFPRPVCKTESFWYSICDAKDVLFTSVNEVVKEYTMM